MDHFDLANVEIFERDYLTFRVVQADEEEILVVYDDQNDKPIGLDIGKPPIIKCKACGKIFRDIGFEVCDCPKSENLYVDIDNRYLYVRLGGCIEKAEMIRKLKPYHERRI